MNPSCEDVKIGAITPLGQSRALFELWLEAPARKFVPGQFVPGQFVMVRPASFGLELPWGRPFSIWRWNEQGLGLLIQTAGRGTARLRDSRPGDSVTIWGPLGNGFTLEPDTPALLLAGGVGLAPLAALAENHPRPENLELIFGHRELLDCYPFETLSKRLVCEAHRECCPEDLAAFIDLLDQRIAAYSGRGRILACGPLPFLKTVQRAANKHDARCQLSLENRMACGIGACLGCVSNNAEGWPVQVCTAGPVFNADEIRLDQAD